MKTYSLRALKFPLALSLMALAPHGFAAGFDCAKASSSVEKMICANAALSTQDKTLNNFYSWTLESTFPVNRPKVIADQKNWVEHTRNACTAIDCLSNAYDGRIEELSTVKFEGGSATYVSDAAEIDRIIKQMQQNLQKVGINQPLDACSHVLSLDSHSSSHGAFCNLGKQKQIAICDENMFGSLAVNFYGEQKGASLAAFTKAACVGG